MINFIPLTHLDLLTEHLRFQDKPLSNGVFVFKHSTRCFISKMVKQNLEVEWDSEKITEPVFLLNVIENRNLSNQIAEMFQVDHESPQLLYLKNGKCVGNASHQNVSIQTVDGWLNG